MIKLKWFLINQMELLVFWQQHLGDKKYSSLQFHVFNVVPIQWQIPGLSEGVTTNSKLIFYSLSFSTSESHSVSSACQTTTTGQWRIQFRFLKVICNFFPKLSLFNVSLAWKQLSARARSIKLDSFRYRLHCCLAPQLTTQNLGLTARSRTGLAVFGTRGRCSGRPV